MNKYYALLLSGYIGWGLFPLYWQLLVHIAPLEVILHRIIWAVPVLALLVHTLPRRHRELKRTFTNIKDMKILIITAILITLNWGIYVWAVANARVVEASMGYFLTPLINIVAGVLIFNEHLTKLKWLAVGLATLGVMVYIFAQGSLPWVGLSVGISFASYGILRKKTKTNAIVGLYVETLMIAPIAMLWVFFIHYQNEAVFLNLNMRSDVLLVLAGLVTIVPLALFTSGIKGLPMASVGLLFFITPSLQFLCGIFILGEVIEPLKLIAFAIIWLGVGAYCLSLWQQGTNQVKD